MYYRLYFTYGADHISAVLPFECVNDTVAKAIAKLRAQGATYELWNQGRMVTQKRDASEVVEFPVGLLQRGFNI